MADSERAVHDFEPSETTLTKETVERAKEAGGPRASLVVYYNEQVKVMPLPEGGELVVGRSYPADLVIDDPSLSRKHARFTRLDEGVKVEDLGSTNGTHFAGERIETVLLGPGEAITLGSVTVSINLASASAPLLEGVESYERYFVLVADELLRAREFHRPLAQMLIRSLGANAEQHVSTWIPRIRNTLRPVDRLALFGENAVLVLLPETDRDRARMVATALVESNRLGEPTLVAGCALFGASAGELVDTARSLARQARTDQKTVIEGDGDTTTVTDRPLWVSASMVVLRETIQRVARSTIPVLVQGETGSGKEVVARAVHDAGPRASGPMRSVNCGAIPANLLESMLFGHERGAFTGAERTTPGLFEQASGGTLFLDEVGELSTAAQAALLRVLETQRLTRVGGAHEIEVDVRVVCATHCDLEAMVQEGAFRQDLLFRLNPMSLRVPPLRERTEDIEPLLYRFLAEASEDNGGRVMGIDPEAKERLIQHRWPGNVRELRNVIERAVVICMTDMIGVDDLPDPIRDPAPALPTEPPAARRGPLDTAPDAEFKDRIKAYEVRLILDALERCDGNQTQAAKMLRMPLRTLVHKIKTYGLKKR